MPTGLSEEQVGGLLPGTWVLAATNFPQWLGGGNHDTTFTFELERQHPLVLRELVQYTTAENTVRQVVGTDAWHADGFTWRGKGRLRFAPRRWAVAGVSEDSTILVLRFSKSRAAQDGLDVLVREDHSYPELRRVIAHEAESFGVGSEDFASLTWFD